MNNEVIVERLDSLIKQNRIDHNKIVNRLDLTNGNVKRNTKWRYSFVSAGIIITTAVIPLVLYIASTLQMNIEKIETEMQQLAERP